MINAADTANEVQGVIAHELGHVVGGHAVIDAGGKAATNISILSLLLGAAAAAAGGGEAAMGVLMAGQQAAMGKYLAFSRAQESTADAAGAQFLSKAGISGKGSLTFFGKLQNLAYRAGYYPREGDEFYRTHPMTEDRIATLEDVYQKDPAWAKPSDPQLEARFLRAKAKLYGYLAEPKDTLTAYPGKVFDNNYTLNTVDICPVGALTSRDFRFQMRVWFLKETRSLCTSCARGCNIVIGSRQDKVYRYEPRENPVVNSCWMCDYGRLNYKWIGRPDRLAEVRTLKPVGGNTSPSWI